jgi:hypothetical protein
MKSPKFLFVPSTVLMTTAVKMAGDVKSSTAK